MGLLSVGLIVTAGEVRAQPSLGGGIASAQVDAATDLESIKTDLALCAPHLAQLREGPDAEAFHEGVEDPQCVKAVVAAQKAGLSKAEIVNILMGASDIPDPNGPTVDHDGPARVIE